MPAPGDPLARVHAATQAAADRAIAALQAAYALGDTPEFPELVQGRVA
jgi:thymidine phosphorylase